jgi:lysophospholipase L1-like esterase
MRYRLAICTIGLAALLLGAAVAGCAQGAFPLKDGDTWVMAGDSITAQHLHSNYFEAFCYARFPQLNFCFRNSGVGGDTIPRVLARFDWDVAAWKPTVVSVELGMNDAGGYTTEAFMGGMSTLVGRIRDAGARPVLLSASPVNNGIPSDKLTGHDARLKEYAAALGDYAAKEGIPYADQFTPLVDVWAANKPLEAVADTLGVARSLLASQPDVLGADGLRAFVDAWAKSGKQPVSLQGNPVHPGPPGQLTMAAALLSKLNAPGLVSKATVDAATARVTEAVQCSVANVAVQADGVSFDRTDDALPFPIPDDARSGLSLTSFVSDLSQYLLTVTGLKPGTYDLVIDGVGVARVTAEQLSAGFNMGMLDKGPVANQCRSILSLVSAKEGIVGQWRAVSKAAAAGDVAQKAQLEKLTAQTLEADAKIRAAARPVPHHFQIAAVK